MRLLNYADVSPVHKIWVAHQAGVLADRLLDDDAQGAFFTIFAEARAAPVAEEDVGFREPPPPWEPDLLFRHTGRHYEEVRDREQLKADLEHHLAESCPPSPAILATAT